MSTENTNLDVTDTDTSLDDFATELFGESQKPSDTAKSEDEPEDEVKDDAPEETDTHSADDGATEDSEESDENPDETDEDEEPAANQPKKANRLQERINELTAARREAERRAEEAERKLAEKDKPTEPKPQDTGKPAPTTLEGPKPSDLNEDGTDKYPLGEFDPQFLRDTVQHMLTEQQKVQQAEAARLEEQRKAEAQRNELQETWNTKLVDARERYPDFQDKGEQMLSVFGGIDEAYGEYLTTTLMEMDAGPDVFYYLSNNIKEAEEIVNAGPRKATIALAKIEAQLVGNPVNKVPKPKTTNTSAPPPRLKGSAVSKGSVTGDTEDLDAFSRELFKRK